MLLTNLNPLAMLSLLNHLLANFICVMYFDNLDAALASESATSLPEGAVIKIDGETAVKVLPDYGVVFVENHPAVRAWMLENGREAWLNFGQRFLRHNGKIVMARHLWKRGSRIRYELPGTSHAKKTPAPAH